MTVLLQNDDRTNSAVTPNKVRADELLDHREMPSLTSTTTDHVRYQHHPLQDDTRHHHHHHRVSPDSPQSLPHKLIGRRKQRLKALRSALDRSSSPTRTENVQVTCLGFSEDPYSVLQLERVNMDTKLDDRNDDDDNDNDEDHEDHAVIAIEATAIGPLDVAIRRGNGSSLPLPFVLGSSFVGVVQKTWCGSTAKRDFDGITKGTRVTSMIKSGANARLITLPVQQLIVIPKRLDAADVACVVSLYLPAFQALHYGTPRPWRYSPKCLTGKRVLITGASMLEAHALTWLARHAGAVLVFVSTCIENFDRITSFQAVPIDDDPVVLLNTLDGLIIDVMIEYDFPRYLHVAQEVLDDEKGRLVCCSASPTMEEGPVDETRLCGLSPTMIVDCWPAMDYFFEQSTLCLVHGATMFNFFDSWQNNPMEMHKDLSFLLGLLNSRHLRPHIDRFISLDGIPKAHHDMQNGKVHGSIVCEPWKD